MGKKGISELLGQTIRHRKLGELEVIEICNEEECKFYGRIAETSEIKKFILSTQFFKGVSAFKTVEIKPQRSANQSNRHKKVNLNKYRNHPLVKEIDKNEKKKKSEESFIDDVIASL